jgi:outer membrane protein OmpA-like peptidoglycan-associated protein
MSSSSTSDSSKVVDEDQPSRREDDLVELRRLLLGSLQTEVDRLKQRLDDPSLHARDVSGILPDAIVLRSSQDEKLATSLVPTVEEILKASVKRDPQTLANALFPVLGPAIRKAIFETVKRMIQSVDQIIGQSFSWQGLKWRVEAFRTGTSFGEIALRHSLLYRVEQIFLIHKETGLLLQHVLAEFATAHEPDMVSSMLTAIQDFIHDSFKTEREDTLDAIQIGELTIWIEQGPLAVIAGVIRGNPPETLRLVFIEALENIHLEQRQALESFNGDAAHFETVRHYLESCLRAQYKPGKRKISPISVVALAALILSIGFWSFYAVQSNRRWAAYFEKLSADPGIVIIEAGKRDGKYFVSGLRDPLATDPSVLLKEAELDPQKIIFRWEPYYALNDRFILMRARQRLKPPETVLLKLEDGVLTAEGSAPHQWIRELRRHLPAIPGIVEFKEDSLIDRDFEELAALREKVEKTVLRFETNTTRLLPDQSETVGDLATQAQRLLTLAELVGASLHIEVVGHADTSGRGTENVKLSQKRANEILAFLISRGIDPAILTAVGVGTKQPLCEEFAEQDRKCNRSATFRTTLRQFIEQKS